MLLRKQRGGTGRYSPAIKREVRRVYPPRCPV
nr:MAG TPA: hypothetical protein [Caudoviricetes sp.]